MPNQNKTKQKKDSASTGYTVKHQPPLLQFFSRWFSSTLSLRHLWNYFLSFRYVTNHNVKCQLMKDTNCQNICSMWTQLWPRNLRVALTLDPPVILHVQFLDTAPESSCSSDAEPALSIPDSVCFTLGEDVSAALSGGWPWHQKCSILFP